MLSGDCLPFMKDDPLGFTLSMGGREEGRGREGRRGEGKKGEEKQTRGNNIYVIKIKECYKSELFVPLEEWISCLLHHASSIDVILDLIHLSSLHLL